MTGDVDATECGASAAAPESQQWNYSRFLLDTARWAA
jgi:hypothetical protein